jgi:hypothetical protein
MTIVQKALLFRGLFSPSLVLAVGGRRVGVVGYLTPETLGIRHHHNFLFLTRISVCVLTYTIIRNLYL